MSYWKDKINTEAIRLAQAEAKQRTDELIKTIKDRLDALDREIKFREFVKQNQYKTINQKLKK